MRALPTFRGYTVDFRLRQFRKVVFGNMPEFIDFASDMGRKLLAAYRCKRSEGRCIIWITRA